MCVGVSIIAAGVAAVAMFLAIQFWVRCVHGVFVDAISESVVAGMAELVSAAVVAAFVARCSEDEFGSVGFVDVSAPCCEAVRCGGWRGECNGRGGEPLGAGFLIGGVWGEVGDTFGGDEAFVWVDGCGNAP